METERSWVKRRILSENQVWGNGTVRNKKAKSKGGQHPENIYLKIITESGGMKEGHLSKKEDKGTQPYW